MAVNDITMEDALKAFDSYDPTTGKFREEGVPAVDESPADTTKARVAVNPTTQEHVAPVGKVDSEGVVNGTERVHPLATIDRSKVDPDARGMKDPLNMDRVRYTEGVAKAMPMAVPEGNPEPWNEMSSVRVGKDGSVSVESPVQRAIGEEAKAAERAYAGGGVRDFNKAISATIDLALDEAARRDHDVATTQAEVQDAVVNGSKAFLGNIATRVADSQEYRDAIEELRTVTSSYNMEGAGAMTEDEYDRAYASLTPEQRRRVDEKASQVDVELKQAMDRFDQEYGRIWQRESGKASDELAEEIQDAMVARERPKTWYGYLGSKVWRENTIQDLATLIGVGYDRDKLNLMRMSVQDYEERHGSGLSIAGNVLALLGEAPSFALTGSVAQLGTKGATSIARKVALKQLAKGMGRMSSIDAAVKARLAAQAADKVARSAGFAKALQVAQSGNTFALYDEMRYLMSGEDLSASDALKKFGRGFMLGAGVGAVGMGNRAYSRFVGRSNVSPVIKQLDRLGEGARGIMGESAVFTAGEVLMPENGETYDENKIFEAFIRNLGLMGGMKIAHASIAWTKGKAMKQGVDRLKSYAERPEATEQDRRRYEWALQKYENFKASTDWRRDYVRLEEMDGMQGGREAMRTIGLLTTLTKEDMAALKQALPEDRFALMGDVRAVANGEKAPATMYPKMKEMRETLADVMKDATIPQMTKAKLTYLIDGKVDASALPRVAGYETYTDEFGKPVITTKDEDGYPIMTRTFEDFGKAEKVLERLDDVVSANEMLDAYDSIVRADGMAGYVELLRRYCDENGIDVAEFVNDINVRRAYGDNALDAARLDAIRGFEEYRPDGFTPMDNALRIREDVARRHGIREEDVEKIVFNTLPQVRNAREKAVYEDFRRTVLDESASLREKRSTEATQLLAAQDNVESKVRSQYRGRTLGDTGLVVTATTKDGRDVVVVEGLEERDGRLVKSEGADTVIALDEQGNRISVVIDEDSARVYDSVETAVDEARSRVAADFATASDLEKRVASGEKVRVIFKDGTEAVIDGKDENGFYTEVVRDGSEAPERVSVAVENIDHPAAEGERGEAIEGMTHYEKPVEKVEATEDAEATETAPEERKAEPLAVRIRKAMEEGKVVNATIAGSSDIMRVQGVNDDGTIRVMGSKDTEPRDYTEEELQNVIAMEPKQEEVVVEEDAWPKRPDGEYDIDAMTPEQRVAYIRRTGEEDSFREDIADMVRLQQEAVKKETEKLKKAKTLNDKSDIRRNIRAMEDTIGSYEETLRLLDGETAPKEEARVEVEPKPEEAVAETPKETVEPAVEKPAEPETPVAETKEEQPKAVETAETPKAEETPIEQRPYGVSWVGEKPRFRKATMDMLDKAARRLGVRIVFMPKMKANTEKGEFDANAMYGKDNTIYLNADANISYHLQSILGHETVHWIKDMDAKAYEALRDEAIASMRKLGIYDSRREEALRYYAEKDVDEELVADFCGEVVADRKVLADFVAGHKSDPTFLDKVLKCIMKAIDYMRGDMGGNAEATDVENVERIAASMGKRIASVYEMMAERRKDVGAMLATGGEGYVEKSGQKTMYVDADNNLHWSLATAKPWVDEFGNRHDGTFKDIDKYMRDKKFSSYQRNEMQERMKFWYGFMENVAGMSDENGNIRYPEFAKWCNSTPKYKVVAGKFMRAFTALVKNGEYSANIELTTDCIKRETYTALLNELVMSDISDNLLKRFTPETIADVQKVMKAYGMQVACPLCFVEGKRYNIVSWAKKFIDDWNGCVRNYARTHGIDPDSITNFDFAKGDEGVISAEDLVDPSRIDEYVRRDAAMSAAYKKSIIELDIKYEKEFREMYEKLSDREKALCDEYSRAIKDLREKQVQDARDFLAGQELTKKQKEEIEKIQNHVRETSIDKMNEMLMVYTTPENSDLLHYMTYSDLLGSKGLDAIRSRSSVSDAFEKLYSAIITRSGTATPKPMQGANPYSGELRELHYKTIEKADKEGGVRMFSFSDFDITKVFDIMQVFYDCEVKQAKLQAYTKEVPFILLFGSRSNAKINMSMLPEVRVPKDLEDEYNRLIDERIAATTKEQKEALDNRINQIRHEVYENAGLEMKDGRFAGFQWSNSHSIREDFAKRIYHDDRYNANCGAIAVGVSVNHALRLAMTDYIRMCIPFHLSGMPIAARRASDVKFYRDFTKEQNTRVFIPADEYARLKQESKENGENIEADATKVKGGGVYMSIHSSNKAVKEYLKRFKDDPDFAKGEDFNFYKGENEPGWDMRAKVRQYVSACKRLGWKPRFEWGVNAEAYKAYCDEVGYKVDKEVYDYMKAHETDGVFDGYYKFITDFNPYKPKFDKDGRFIGEESAPHEKVKGEFSRDKDVIDALFTGKHTMLDNRERSIRAMKENIGKIAGMTKRILEGENVDVLLEEEKLSTENGFDNAQDSELYMGMQNVEDTPYEENVRYSISKTEPKETRKVYKLMRLKDGKLYPLFIDSANEIRLGTWYDAEAPDFSYLKTLPSGIHLVSNDGRSSIPFEQYASENGIAGRTKPNVGDIEKATAEGKRFVTIRDAETDAQKASAEGRYGDARRYYNWGVNGSGQASDNYAMRAGWHSGSLPTMRQIGKTAGRDKRDDSFVWVEGSIPADVDYNAIAERNPDKDMPTEIPVNGYYLKATNPNKAASQSDKVGWYVSGAFRADRIMTDAETEAVIDRWNAEHGDSILKDWPRENGMKFGGVDENGDPTFYNPSATKDNSAMGNTPRYTEDADTETRMRSINGVQKRPEYTEPMFGPDVQYSINKRSNEQIDKWLVKRGFEDKDRNIILDYISNNFEGNKAQLAAGKWIANGTVRMGEDDYKVRQALDVAEKKKLDPMQYDSPMAIINMFPEAVKEKPIDPDTVPTLKNRKELAEGITIYDVEESEESRQNMRRIINTHYGKDASPWCLLQGDSEGNLTNDSRNYWDHYNEYPKRVAFQNGKLKAFFASDDEPTWWDRSDEPHKGIPITRKAEHIGNGVVANGYVDEKSGEFELDMYSRGNKTNGLYEEWNKDGVKVKENNYVNEWNEGRQRSWYDNGQLRSDCTFTRKYGRRVLVGEALSYYDNGQLEVKITYPEGLSELGMHEGWYKNGLLKERYSFDKINGKQGKYESWHYNGVKESESTYKDGMNVDTERKWYDNGQLSTERTFRDNGQRKDLRLWYKNGQLKVSRHFNDRDKHEGREEEFFEDGSLERITDFRDGIIVGLDEFYSSPGRLSYREHFDNDGKLHGESIHYSKFGNSHSVTNYKHGVKDGVAEEYREDNNLMSRFEFKDGKKDGVSRMWSPVPNEKGEYPLLIEIHWKDDKYDGPTYEWYLDGTLKNAVMYKDGKEVGPAPDPKYSVHRNFNWNLKSPLEKDYEKAVEKIRNLENRLREGAKASRELNAKYKRRGINVDKLKQKVENFKATAGELYGILSSPETSTAVIEEFGRAEYQQVVSEAAKAISAVSDKTPEEAFKAIEPKLVRIRQVIATAYTRRGMNDIVDLLDGTMAKVDAKGVRVGIAVDEDTRQQLDIVRRAISEQMDDASPKDYVIKAVDNDGLLGKVALRTEGEVDMNVFNDLMYKADKASEAGESRKALEYRALASVINRYNEILKTSNDIAEARKAIREMQSDNFRLKDERSKLPLGSTEKRRLTEQINANREEIAGTEKEVLRMTGKMNSQVARFAGGLGIFIEKGINGWKEFVGTKEERKAEFLDGVIRSMINPEAKVLPMRGMDTEGRPVSPWWKWNRNKNHGMILFNGQFGDSFENIAQNLDRNSVPGYWTRNGVYYQMMLDPDHGWMARHDFMYGKQQEFMGMLDDKCREMFGRTFAELGKDAQKQIDIDLGPLRSSPESRLVQSGVRPTIAQALYIRNVVRQPNGLAGYLRWGMTEEKVNEIVAYMETMYPEYCEFADYVVRDFMPKLYEMQDEVYFDKYGTHLAQTTDYFPFRRDKGKVARLPELGQDDAVKLPTAMTGNIIERTSNKVGMDLTADMFGVLQDHVNETVKWTAYTPLIDRFNAMITSRFINEMFKVQGIDRSRVARSFARAVSQAQDIVETMSQGGKVAVNTARNVIAGKINLNLNAALKQFVSGTCALGYTCEYHKMLPLWAKNFFTPSVARWSADKLLKLVEEKGYEAYDIHKFAENWKWAIENLPTMRERWQSKFGGYEEFNLKAMSGNRFFDSWNDLTDAISKVGMSPNGLIDFFTCANVGRSVYEYQHAKNLDRGMSKEDAEWDARVKAATFVNQTQQSPLSAYLSSFQTTRNPFLRVAGASFGAYQNTSRSFMRNNRNAQRNILRMLNPSNRAQMAKELKSNYMQVSDADEKQIDGWVRKDMTVAFLNQVNSVLHNGIVSNLAWDTAAKLLAPLSGAVILEAVDWLTGNTDDESKIGKVLGNEEVMKSVSEIWTLPYLMKYRNPLLYNSPFGKGLSEAVQAWTEKGNTRGVGSGIFENPVFSSIDDMGRVFNREVIGTEDSIGTRKRSDNVYEDRSIWTLGANVMTEALFGINTPQAMRMTRGIEGMFRDGADLEDVMNLLSTPRGVARAIAGEMKPDETEDEYMARLAYTQRVVTSIDENGHVTYPNRWMQEKQKEYERQVNNRIMRSEGIDVDKAEEDYTKAQDIWKAKGIFTIGGDERKGHENEYGRMSAEEKKYQNDLYGLYMDVYYADQLLKGMNVVEDDEARRLALVRRAQAASDMVALWEKHDNIKK